jgi:hypothetical protein
MKEMFARLPTSKPCPTVGISLLRIPFSGPLQPDQSRPGMIVTEPSAIEDHILCRNSQHFSQAESTDFAQQPLKSVFNWQGTGRTIERVLNNQYETNNDGTLYDISSTANKILKVCYCRLPAIIPELTLPNMKQAYKRWNENTSTSPSGRHLGHYHALLKPDGLNPDSDEFVALATSREEIWKLHHILFDYGIRNAHCFSRWKDVVNAMIEKEPGNPWIHRLRVIHLYKNDYNLLLGSQYRVANHRVEDAEAINDGNFGARTARSSLDPVGIKILQYEYSRLLRL